MLYFALTGSLTFLKCVLRHRCASHYLFYLTNANLWWPMKSKHGGPVTLHHCSVFCRHLILYSFYFTRAQMFPFSRGRRTFISESSSSHCWLSWAPSSARTFFTWFCEDFIEQTGSNDQHGSLLPKRKSWVAVCYPESFEVIGVAISSSVLDKQDVTWFR